MLSQAQGDIRIRAPRQGLHPITDQVARWLSQQAIEGGLLTVFCTHTTASLLIQATAAPPARRDLGAYFAKIAPESTGYEHGDEGPDDMPAHLRTALTQTQLAIPVRGGRLALGTWQGLYLFEHRRHPPERRLLLHLVGE